MFLDCSLRKFGKFSLLTASYNLCFFYFFQLIPLKAEMFIVTLRAIFSRDRYYTLVASVLKSWLGGLNHNVLHTNLGMVLRDDLCIVKYRK